MSNLYDVLETCLLDIENGADLETILFRYPDLADELRPILEASIQAKRIRVPDPSSERMRRNRARLLHHAAQLREAKGQSSRRLWSVPLRRVMVTLAVIVALFIGSTNLVRAASTTLPGDNLYPVKRTWEDVLVLLTFNIQARTALEVSHENERLEELYELFAEERSARVDFAGLVTRQNGDLWLVSKIPVVISAQTDIRDQAIGVGDAIRVRGTTQADGTVLAERVELLDADKPLPDVDDDDAPEIEQEDDGNENKAGEDNSGHGSEGEAPDPQQTAVPEGESEPEEISLEGVVSSVNGTTVIVNGVTMDISNAEIRGTPAAGADVKVEGYYGSNNVFIVTKIEFFSNNSNSVDNGDSNDNGSDDNSGSSNSDDDDNSNSDDNSGSGHSGGDDSNDNGGND